VVTAYVATDLAGASLQRRVARLVDGLLG